jgi:hypothetical protein
MGICSLVIPVLCGILGAMVGIGLGLGAVIMSFSDIRQMRSGSMDPDGEGTTRAGQVLGFIGVALSLLFMLGCGAFMLVMMLTEMARNP